VPALTPLAEGSESLATLAEDTQTLSALAELTNDSLPALYPSSATFPSARTFPSSGVSGQGLTLTVLQEV
jgi:hypothetical protein